MCSIVIAFLSQHTYTLAKTISHTKKCFQITYVAQAAFSGILECVFHNKGDYIFTKYIFI